MKFFLWFEKIIIHSHNIKGLIKKILKKKIIFLIISLSYI
jgi:hypothetical protein